MIFFLLGSRQHGVYLTGRRRRISENSDCGGAYSCSPRGWAEYTPIRGGGVGGTSSCPRRGDRRCMFLSAEGLGRCMFLSAEGPGRCMFLSAEGPERCMFLSAEGPGRGTHQ